MPALAQLQTFASCFLCALRLLFLSFRANNNQQQRTSRRPGGYHGGRERRNLCAAGAFARLLPQHQGAHEVHQTGGEDGQTDSLAVPILDLLVEEYVGYAL